MKKNGFISTSLIYTFFLIFLTLMLLLLNSYAKNRTLLNEYKDKIKESFTVNNTTNNNNNEFIINVYVLENSERQLITYNEDMTFDENYTFQEFSCQNSSNITFNEITRKLEIEKDTNDKCDVIFIMNNSESENTYE